ncbi:MAG: L,D-transpeptidase [Myxococcales bacterium]|nr:L,D-transpeptidase [Myxococcales bacterium]
MRTWVYQEPDDESTKLGYLRAGAVVERARDPAGTRGCEGGWYAVEPRGYVCVGKGASLELDHPVRQAAFKGPERGEPMPYRYVISRSPPPHLYFKLPSEEEQEDAEGKKRRSSMALFDAGPRSLLGPPDPIPPFLADGGELPKPYGAERPLHYRSHRGRANEESAFGLMAHFDWGGRMMGLTTELDLIPIDRTRIAPLSDVAGAVVDLEKAPEEGTEPPWLPAVVARHGLRTHEVDERGQSRAVGTAPRRTGWVLTGREERGLAETTAGVWLPKDGLLVAELRDDPARFAEHGRKWIDVSIEKQLLVAYEGRRPVFATFVSTGRGELGDPEKTHATVRGTVMIHAKHVSATMDGDDDTRESFDLHDVPYIQYFYKGYALHGAYWHDDFGKVRSHGCVNLAPRDAAWLFDWTYPEVPAGWHGALNLAAGTLVYIHR